MNETPASFFTPGQNCWQVETASHAALLVDYAPYYHALYEAICRAKYSVFIIGWDIDSRIEMVRGDDAKNLPEGHCPTIFFELIQAKARQNPDLQIYLNKWNYSHFFARERELLAGIKWRLQSEPNVHYTVDSFLPVAACHHQKIVVVDDEVAFSGGMDIAANRWDWREHHPVNPDRQDPEGVVGIEKKAAYAPYHDIQMIVAGPVTRRFGEWARYRWRTAGQKEAVALRTDPQQGLPACWPPSVTPVFTDTQIAIARTLPAVKKQRQVDEIEKLFLDEIVQAEHFIYIENQFLTRLEIAEALNAQLRRKPGLRVLAISCDHPKGIMEKKSMWTGRVHFRDRLEKGGVADRTALAYPISREDGREDPVRIHSKLMVIDDRFLHVGSANINNRSMGMDTECDLVIEAHDDATREKISALRNDLIREHTGREIEWIEKTVQHGAVTDFLTYLSTSRQHLRKIDDEQYRYEHFAELAQRISDPERPIIASKNVIPLAAAFLVVVALLLSWKFTPLSDYATPDAVVPFFKHLRESVWVVPIIMAIYVAGAFVLFPVMVLDMSTVLAFGLPWGPFMALGGVSASATFGFILGRLMGRKKAASPPRGKQSEIARHLTNIGVVGMALLRMLPVAPFSVVNFAVGAARVPYWIFITGTWLGLVPGLCTLSLLRGPMLEFLHHPDPANTLKIAGGAAVWMIILYCLNHYGKRWRERKEQRVAA